MSVASGSGRRYLSDDEIAALAAEMRVADPDNNQGDFNTFSRSHVFQLLKLFDVPSLDSQDPISDEEALRRLRLALWDSQRYASCRHHWNLRLGIAEYDMSFLGLTTFFRGRHSKTMINYL